MRLTARILAGTALILVAILCEPLLILLTGRTYHQRHPEDQ